MPNAFRQDDCPNFSRDQEFIQQRDRGVKPHSLARFRHFLQQVERIGQAGSFQDDIIGGKILEDALNRPFQVARQAAADTALINFGYLVIQQFAVEAESFVFAPTFVFCSDLAGFGGYCFWQT